MGIEQETKGSVDAKALNPVLQNEQDLREPHGLEISGLPTSARASIEYKNKNTEEISISGNGVSSTFFITDGILVTDSYTALDDNQIEEDKAIHNERYMLVQVYLFEQNKTKGVLPADIEDFY